MCHPTGRVFGAPDLERSTHFIDVSCIGVRYFECTEPQFRKLLIKIIQAEIACKYKSWVNYQTVMISTYKLPLRKV